MSSPKLSAHLTISRSYWDECEKLGLSPVGTRPVLVIDSNDLLPYFLLKMFLFRGFNISEVIIGIEIV
ncbi:MAG: hypothetical protein ACW991_05850 [Candidatus Hodarchaeales archaeon]